MVGIKLATKNSPDWKLQGDYFEGCNCDSMCPCIFLLDPDKGYCNATVAWHIEKGHYDQTQLGTQCGSCFRCTW